MQINIHNADFVPGIGQGYRQPPCTNAVDVAAVTCGDPAAIVVVCSISATSPIPLSSAVSVSTTSIGELLENWSRRIRDPVVTISSMTSSSASASSTSWAGADANGSNRPPADAEILDAVFSDAPVGIGIWDRDLKFMKINPLLAEMNGLPPEAHIGKTPKELLPEVKDIDGSNSHF